MLDELGDAAEPALGALITMVNRNSGRGRKLFGPRCRVIVQNLSEMRFMDTTLITPTRLADSVIAVPPLARDATGRICSQENRRLIQYLEDGNVSTLLYGGNAVLYHVRLSEYRLLLEMLVDSVSESTLVIPSVGPAYGFMMDQAEVLRDFAFPTVMILPQSDVADPTGIATGIRRFAEAIGKPIVLYIKQDRWLSADHVGRLVHDGLVSWVKYAVVRDNPAQDDYLREIVTQIPANMIVSGIGEQPAIVHMKDFGVVSYTSGCVCLAPKLLQKCFMRQSGEVESRRVSRKQFLR